MDHEDFRKLTGYEPFPWQEALYKRFVAEKGNAIPRVVSLPTGLGKTNVIAVWLLALANGADLPRRLVYVVNRRTVVDQTTTEVERLRHNLPQLKRPSFDTLAISTLRGQFADNREWSADPSKPAVICGTVDMIGSRLLFSGYGVGYKAKPLHAGFLGQDVLLVHDEAHLEPAFQTLIDTIRREQDRCKDFTRFHIMELTATTRSGSGQDTTAHFTLGQKDRKHSVVKQRLEATKHLHLTQAKDDAKVAQEIADVGLKRRRMNDDNGDTHAAVLIFVRTLDDVKKISEKLANNKTGVGPDCVQQLTGTMRGLERDRMADPRGPNASRVFARFLKPPKNDAPQSERWKVEPMPGTVYLVCTSAGEVGIDISADHMVCDLSTFDSMAQRLGRVNRYGERSDTRIDVVHPASFGKKEKRTGELQADAIDKRREETLQLLRTLNGDASPKALGELAPAARQAAFAPEPVILPATDILFDAWSMTSIRKPMPGRPPVEPYLHGIRDWEPPETHVAWREEVEVITGDLLETYPPADLLDDYPLKPHELLRDRSDRVFKQLEALWQRHASKPAWLIDDRGTIEVMTLDQLTDKQRKDRINGRTVLLSPSAGGLSGGMLDGASDHADDVADAAIDEQSRVIRQRTWDPNPNSTRAHLRRIRTIDTRPDADESGTDEASAQKRFWYWYDLPLEGGRTSNRPVTWNTHVSDVVDHATRIVQGLSLPQEIADAVIIAAQLHDHGKQRERFQITLGNRKYPHVLLAKSGRRGARLPEPFRHEFASVLDAQIDKAYSKLSEEMKDLVLHLIAAHHGRARPHFGQDEAIDLERPQDDAESLAKETPRRFARLQRHYGRWGLAYLESLLRAADWAASAAPSKVLDANGNEVTP